MDGQRAAEAVVGLRKLELLRFPGVGWLEIKTYPRYRGRDPRTGEMVDVAEKRAAFFIADPDLKLELDGGKPEHREFKDELTRFLSGLHPDGDFEGEEAFTVLRFGFVDSVAAQVRARLLARTSAEVAGLGTFSLNVRADRTTVKFTPAPELTTALNKN